MTIYSRMGAEVRLLDRIRNVEDVAQYGEEPDELAAERVAAGQWFLAELSADGKPLEGKRIVDLALCRADGGSAEITKAAQQCSEPLLQLVCDDSGYWLHNPLTGADVTLFHDEDETRPIMPDEFKAARAKALELYPGADIRG